MLLEILIGIGAICLVAFTIIFNLFIRKKGCCGCHSADDDDKKTKKNSCSGCQGCSKNCADKTVDK